MSGEWREPTDKNKEKSGSDIRRKEFIMSFYWILGFAVGVVLVAIICSMGRRMQKKAGKKPADYDERQVAARGKCFQTAFFTLFSANVIMALLAVIFDGYAILEGPVPYLILIFLGATVFVTAAIRNDAYFRPGEASKGYTFIFGALGILNLIGGISHIVDGSMLDEAGRMDTGCMNLMAGLFLVITAAAILIKQVQDRKAAADDEGDAE